MARTTDAIPNSLEVRPLCIFAVSGLACVVDDALFRPALPQVLSDPNYKPKTLVFFGGDVQNFLTNMDTSDSKINCHRWCLEAAAQRLGSSFPSHHIVVIKPSRTLYDHVNCYDNFVHSNYVGSPTYVYHYKGLLHLERLLYKISKRIRISDSDELFKLLLKVQEDEIESADEDDPTANIVWQYEVMPKKRKEALVRWKKKLHLERYPLTLVAFSKGCVVLNQFLYEFHYARGLEPNLQDSSFINRIEHIYWLDGGHPGRFDVYPTSRGVLRTVSELGIQLHLHLSEYQINDYLRPWIRQQCNEFINTLRSFNAKLVVHCHVSEYADLRAHWNVFLSFMQKENEPAPPQATGPPPSPGPRAPSPPPAPHGPRRYPNTPQERAFMHREVLGLALVSPNDAPDLGLQVIFRRPLDEIMEPYSGPVVPGAASGTERASAAAQEVADGTSRPSSAHGSPESSDSSAPSGSDEPSTSARNSPARSDSQSRSDSREGPAPLRSSPVPEPSTSTADREPSESEPSEEPPAADGFKVLVKKRSEKIDFNTDPEANDAYESAKYYKMETPVVATVTEDQTSISYNIYTPVKDHYTPTLLDWVRPQGDVDSSTAVTPEGFVIPAGSAPGAAGSAAAGSSTGQPDAAAPQPSTSGRGAPRHNARTSESRHAGAETDPSVPRQRPVRIFQSFESSSSSSEESSQSSSTESDSPPRAARRSRVRRNNTPYSRRGTTRYNLRSSR